MLLRTCKDGCDFKSCQQTTGAGEKMTIQASFASRPSFVAVMFPRDGMYPKCLQISV